MAWGKAGSTTLTSSGSSVEATITASKFNQILNHVITAGTGNIGTRYRLNDDSGSTYAQRWSQDGAADGSAASQGQVFTEINDADEDRFQIGYVCAISGEDKLGINFLIETATGAGTAPQRSETVFKYVPSPDAEVTSVKVMETVAGSFGSDTNLSALGSDLTPAAAAPFAENAQVGSRAEIIDTRKIYYFNEQISDALWGKNSDQVIEDCTTYANTTEGDADYVPSVTGTNECRLNPSTDVIDCRFEDASADHFVAYRDLTGATITDNAWTLRCKVATTVITAPSGGLSHSVFIGMSSTTSNFATSQDFLGISFWNPGASESPNTPKHYAVYRDSALGGTSHQAPAASSIAFTTAWTNSDTYYIEIIRVSDTELTVELFSDSAYTTSVEKQTVSVPSTVTALRYFKAGVYDNANVVGFTMTIDDLEFWEGVNAPTDNVWEELGT
ncbi:hypothetical protein OAU96_02430 [Planctomycetota bacterium]|nr:hypothetical protein [Planctomycetota bacterium]